MGSSDEALLEAVRQLESEGVGLTVLSKTFSLVNFLADVGHSWWLFITVLVTLTEVALVLDQLETGFFGSLRLLFGLAFLGYLPGLATTRMLFPGDQLSGFERVLLSIFLSVAISIALGVALGAVYRFNGATSALLSSLYILGGTMIGGYRQYSWLRKRGLPSAP